MPTSDLKIFYSVTDKAFHCMWPELVRVIGIQKMRKNSIPEVHNFATTAASRIGGIIEPNKNVNGENFGATADMVYEAAGNASAATGRSVDWFLRVYEAASQQAQQGDVA